MKRLFSITLLLLLSLAAFAQRPKVGVVLSGGGARGAAHVGVLKVLEENEIPIDIIVGTSMGSIVGGLYAIGYRAADLDSIVMNQDWNFLMSDRIPRRDRLFERKQDQGKYLLEIPFGAGDYSRLNARSPQRKSDELSILNNIPVAVVNGHNIYNLFTRLSVGSKRYLPKCLKRVQVLGIVRVADKRPAVVGKALSGDSDVLTGFHQHQRSNSQNGGDHKTRNGFHCPFGLRIKAQILADQFLSRFQKGCF